MKMQSKQQYSWKTLLISTAVLVLTGCAQRDLEMMPDCGDLNLFFDWSGLGDADTAPTSMKVLFYNTVGDTLSVSGGSGALQAVLPFGQYKMLTYNKNAQGVGFRNLENLSQAEAYALPLSLPNLAPTLLRMAYAAPAGTYLAQPRNLYGAGGDTLNLLLGDAESDTLKPQTLIKQITLDIKVSGDISSVTSCNLTLENIASGVSLLTGVPIYGKPGTIAFDSNTTTSGFAATMSYFGKDTTAVSHELSLVLTFVDGGVQDVKTDFSTAMEQVEETTIPVNVQVDIDVTHTDAGFKATLQGWNIVEGTIVVGEIQKRTELIEKNKPIK